VNLDRKTFLRGLGAGSLAWLAAPWASAGGAAPALAPPDEASAPGDEAFWARVRAQYRFAEGLHYFNTGGMGPAPLPVRELTARTMDELQDTVQNGHFHFGELRAGVAAWMGADEGEVCFVRNATEGNGIVADGLDLRPGDEVIFEAHAHPGGSFAWLQQARRRGAVVKVFEPDPLDPAGNLARIEALATPRTRVVQVSHVTAPTGIHLLVPGLVELCRARGWWCHVDGAQTLGMFPFSLHELGVDSYAASGHKWLGAPHETGVLYIRADRMAEVEPGIVGAHSGELDHLPGELQLSPTSWRYEYGTRNAALVVGVAAAMRFQDEVGRERIARRGRALAARLRAGLAAVPDLEILSPVHPDLSGPMVTIRSARREFGELFGRLWHDHGYRCRPVSEQGLNAVRISCHLFNTPDEIDGLAEAVGRITRA
jgi:selenocysteine lyase/cysteine desulfurase